VKPTKGDPNQIPSLEKSQKPNQSEKGSYLGTDLNLISSSQRNVLEPESVRRKISLLRSFVIFVSIIFGIVLIANFLMVSVLDSQKRNQDQLLKIVKSYSDVEERAKIIGEKTILYKKILSGKDAVSPKVKFVMNNLGSNVELRDVDLQKTGFSLSIKVDTPYDFTNLISRYLEGDMISEISIESASLDMQDSKFNVYMKGVFK